MTFRTFQRLTRVSAAALFASVALSASATAQSAQKYAVQFAVLSTSIDGTSGNSIGGVGVEPQIRYNLAYAKESLGGLTLGLGGQLTSHSSGGDDLKISGLFLEPRWVPNTGSSRFFPYISGRLALLRQSSNFGSASGGTGIGAGGGFAIKLAPTVNLDAGLALVRQQFGAFVFTDNTAGEFNPFTTYAAKIGITVGFPR